MRVEYAILAINPDLIPVEYYLEDEDGYDLLFGSLGEAEKFLEEYLENCKGNQSFVIQKIYSRGE